jgi:hypothetical protein
MEGGPLWLSLGLVQEFSAARGGNRGKSGTDGTFSDICLTRLLWLTMIGDFQRRETSRLSPGLSPGFVPRFLKRIWMPVAFCPDRVVTRVAPSGEFKTSHTPACGRQACGAPGLKWEKGLLETKQVVILKVVLRFVTSGIVIGRPGPVYPSQHKQE